MSTHTDTVTKQAPTALLALVQHINDHGLGMPLSIHTPSTASPHFSITIVPCAYDAWVESGLVIDEVEEIRPLGGGPIAGKRWQNVTALGKVMLPIGLVPLRVTYARPVANQQPTRQLAAVTGGCFQ